MLRYHAGLGHEVLHLHADGDGLTPSAHRASLELFQSDVAPLLRGGDPQQAARRGPIPFTGPRSTPEPQPVGRLR